MRSFCRVDFVPFVYIMMLVNTTGALSFALAVLHGLTLDFMAITCFSVYIAIFTAQVCIYIRNFFTSVKFGKLFGIASMLGGALSLVSNGLYDGITMRLLNGNASPVMWGFSPSYVVPTCSSSLWRLHRG